MADTGTPGPGRILLVDDDPMMVRLVRKILAAEGYPPVEHAADAREALEGLDGVSVVLLDHQLPDATGLEVLGAIRARPSPPAVVTSSALPDVTASATKPMKSPQRAHRSGLTSDSVRAVSMTTVQDLRPSPASVVFVITLVWLLI